MTKEKRSPLKDNPLRNPGQSLDEEIHKIIEDDASPFFVAPIVSIIYAAIE